MKKLNVGFALLAVTILALLSFSPMNAYADTVTLTLESVGGQLSAAGYDQIGTGLVVPGVAAEQLVGLAVQRGAQHQADVVGELALEVEDAVEGGLPGEPVGAVAVAGFRAVLVEEVDEAAHVDLPLLEPGVRGERDDRCLEAFDGGADPRVAGGDQDPDVFPGQLAGGPGGIDERPAAQERADPDAVAGRSR